MWLQMASNPQPSWGAGKLLLEMYEKTAEPALWGPVLVTDFPAEVSPLARLHRQTRAWPSGSRPSWPDAS